MVRHGRHRGGAVVKDAVRYKTALCKTFQETGSCPYSVRCQFAHGLNELRTRPFGGSRSESTCSECSTSRLAGGDAPVAAPAPAAPTQLQPPLPILQPPTPPPPAPVSLWVGDAGAADSCAIDGGQTTPLASAPRAERDISFPTANVIRQIDFLWAEDNRPDLNRPWTLDSFGPESGTTSAFDARRSSLGAASCASLDAALRAADVGRQISSLWKEDATTLLFD